MLALALRYHAALARRLRELRPMPNWCTTCGRFLPMQPHKFAADARPCLSPSLGDSPKPTTSCVGGISIPEER